MLDTTTKGDEKTAEVAIGFSTDAAKWIDFPGWTPKPNAPTVSSWAHHGDDGWFGASDRRKWPESTYGLHYGPGDTIGCGLDVGAKMIFFTRNGVRLGMYHQAFFILVQDGYTIMGILIWYILCNRPRFQGLHRTCISYPWTQPFDQAAYELRD